MKTAETMDTFFFPFTGNGDLPFYVTAIGDNCAQHAIERPNGYPMSLIIICTKGKGEFYLENRRHVVAKNDVVIIPDNIAHAYTPLDENWAIYWIAFTGFATRQSLAVMNFKHGKCFSAEKAEALLETYGNIYKTLRADTVNGHITASEHLYSLLLKSYKLSFGLRKDTKLNPIAGKALEYIEKYYSEPITLDDIAGVLGISKRHLCRVFKEHVRVTPNEYIIKKRLQEAKLLLSTTQLKIKEVAKKVGFEDSNYFSVVFSKYEGVNPNVFRLDGSR